MKRCPECGFRANDQICPLCGVRMQQSGGAVRPHVHAEDGERCVLPNKDREAVPTRKETIGSGEYRPQSSRRGRQTSPSGFAVVVAVIILISMFRACVGAI